MATARGGFPPSILHQIRDSVDIVDLVSQYVSLSKTGQNYKGLCPFHAEKTPSFSVNSPKQMFYCFGCGAGGDAFTFLIKKEGLTFVEAVKELAERAHIPIPENAGRSFTQENGDQRKILEELHVASKEWFHRNLIEPTVGKSAMQYLQGRGFSTDTLDRFGVGFAQSAWDGLTQYLLKRGAKPADLVRAGLAIAKNVETNPSASPGRCYDRFRGRVMVPITDLRSKIIAFGGRVLDDDSPKYLNSPETPLFNKRRCLFGLDHAREDASRLNTLLIVEGYFDVLALYQAGIKHVCAPLGTALTSEHVDLLRRFVNSVVLTFDGDAAGVNASVRTLDVFLNSGVGVKVLRLPAGDDPDTFVKAQGADAFKELQEQAVPLLDFVIERSLSGAQKSTVEERTRRVDDVLRILAKVTNPIEKEEHTQRVAEQLGIRHHLLLERFPMLLRTRDVKKSPPGPNRSQDNRVPPGKRDNREERDLVVLLLHGELNAQHVKDLRPEDFSVPAHRRLIEIWLEHVRDDGGISLSDVIMESSHDDMCAQLTAELIVDAPHFDDHQEYINGCLRVLKQRRLKSSLDDVIVRLRVAEREGRVEDVKELNDQIEALRGQKADLAMTGLPSLDC